MEVFRRSCADVVTREEKWRTILLNIDLALAKLFSALINEIVRNRGSSNYISM